MAHFNKQLSGQMIERYTSSCAFLSEHQSRCEKSSTITRYSCSILELFSLAHLFSSESVFVTTERNDAKRSTHLKGHNYEPLMRSEEESDDNLTLRGYTTCSLYSTTINSIGATLRVLRVTLWITYQAILQKLPVTMHQELQSNSLSV